MANKGSKWLQRLVVQEADRLVVDAAALAYLLFGQNDQIKKISPGTAGGLWWSTMLKNNIMIFKWCLKSC